MLLKYKKYVADGKTENPGDKPVRFSTEAFFYNFGVNLRVTCLTAAGLNLLYRTGAEPAFTGIAIGKTLWVPYIYPVMRTGNPDLIL